MTPPLHVTGGGMCCAVGFDAPAARAALRAGLSHFEESDFFGDRGQRLLVARLPLGDLWGARRLATMLASVVSECVGLASGFDASSTALLLLLPERGRPGASDTWGPACFAACHAETGRPFHPASRVLPLGRAGVGAALTAAQALLAGDDDGGAPPARVIIAGVDSYLNAPSVNHLLRRERLLSVGATDGFIAGEAAGGVLVELAPPARPALRILGVGAADEEATIDDDVPQRGRGLTAAARRALAASGRRAEEMRFRISDASGEPFHFREAALAAARLLDHAEGEMPLLHIADSVGETGAAVGPLTLAYLADAMPRGHTPGPLALAHFASDGGARAALVCEAYTP